MMRIGVGFPTVEIGADLAVVRDFVHTAEQHDVLTGPRRILRTYDVTSKDVADP
jgi:hypothetical protein